MAALSFLIQNGVRIEALRIRITLMRIRILLFHFDADADPDPKPAFHSDWCDPGPDPTFQFYADQEPIPLTFSRTLQCKTKMTFPLWCGSGSCFSLWCGSGSGFSFPLWCGFGSGSSFPKWCGSMRIRIHNTAGPVPDPLGFRWPTRIDSTPEVQIQFHPYF